MARLRFGFFGWTTELPSTAWRAGLAFFVLFLVGLAFNWALRSGASVLRGLCVCAGLGAGRAFFSAVLFSSPLLGVLCVPVWHVCHVTCAMSVPCSCAMCYVRAMCHARVRSPGLPGPGSRVPSPESGVHECWSRVCWTSLCPLSPRRWIREGGDPPSSGDSSSVGSTGSINSKHGLLVGKGVCPNGVRLCSLVD